MIRGEEGAKEKSKAKEAKGNRGEPEKRGNE